MKALQQISFTVDNWIAEEELPVRANLKVIRRNDPDYGLTEEEIQDRNEFIRCLQLTNEKIYPSSSKNITIYSPNERSGYHIITNHDSPNSAN